MKRRSDGPQVAGAWRDRRMDPLSSPVPRGAAIEDNEERSLCNQREGETMKKSMKQPERTGVLVRLPEELKGAIVAEVERRGTNMNDLIVSALARRFGMPFRPSDRCCHSARAENLTILLRMDRGLKRTIQHHALDAGSNMSDTVTRVLAVELGIIIDLPAPIRQTPFGGGPRKYRRSLPEEHLPRDSEAA